MIWLLLVLILITVLSVYLSHIRERRIHFLTQQIESKVQQSIKTIDNSIEKISARRAAISYKLASTLLEDDITLNQLLPIHHRVGEVSVHADFIIPLYAQFLSKSENPLVKIKSSTISFYIPEFYLMSSKSKDLDLAPDAFRKAYVDLQAQADIFDTGLDTINLQPLFTRTLKPEA